MSETPPDPRATRLAYYGSAVAALGVLTSGPLSMLVVSATKPQPTWQDAATFAANYHPVQLLPYVLGLPLVAGSLAMIVGLCLMALGRFRERAALAASFGIVFATMIFLNYILQSTFVPALVAQRSTTMDPFIEAFSMTNPAAIGWAIEMWGYGFLGVATWLLAPLFAGSRLERWTAALFVLNGVTSIIAAIITAADLRWVFSTAGLAAFFIWNFLYFAAAALAVFALKARSNPEKGNTRNRGTEDQAGLSAIGPANS
jgi:hypothetical protein